MEIASSTHYDLLPDPISDWNDSLLPSRTLLEKALDLFGLSSPTRSPRESLSDKQFVRVVNEGKERAGRVTPFSVNLVPTFASTAKDLEIRVSDLSVTYPSVPMEDDFSPADREILSNGYKGKDPEYWLLNTTWPQFLYVYRPSLHGQISVTVEGHDPVVLPTCLLTVHPSHLWKMLKDPSLEYSSGVHHDSSFGPYGAETRRLLVELLRRRGRTFEYAAGLPPIEDLEVDPSLLLALQETFDPIKAEIQKVGKLVLNVSAVREAVRMRQARDQDIPIQLSMEGLPPVLF